MAYLSFFSTSQDITAPRQHGSFKPLRIFMYVVMCIASLYFIFSLLWLVMASTKSNVDLYTSPGFWFASHLSFFANVQQLLNYDGGIYIQWFGNTFLYAGGSACISMFISALCGYTLAKYHFRGKKLVFNIILVTVMIPSTVLVLPLYLLMSGLHLTNTYWSVLLPTLFSAFGIWFARIYADASIPQELLDAARIDGSGDLYIFFIIGLRLMSPALATIFLLQFTAVWNNFFLPLMMLSNEHLYPLAVGLNVWNGIGADATYTLTNLVITGSLISSLPLVLSFIFLQRYWRSGLSLGSIVS